MSYFHDLYQRYTVLDIGDFTSNQKKQLYSQLKKIRSEDVQSIDDHRKYVELVQKLRQANMEDMNLFGHKFRDTLKSLLSVGEDGVYANRLRFLYELIQNVDDCDYDDISECNLDIEFRYENEPGRIILTYNEIGFTPENVFAITGIAEKSKNISADKIEIGEKGIGFKSVFGIARKVLIESGKFSFELDADNFTVPIPRYDGFIPVRGTRLTLEMSRKDCEGIYRNIVKQYMTKEAILNQNPILFLNKLTHLKMHFDNFRYIEFDVQRAVPERHGELRFEENVTISVDMKDHTSGQDRDVMSTISCYRYTMPIVYGKKECIARYGKDTGFFVRRHNLVAVFPKISEEMEDFKGTLYSFLPTQIKTSVPVILHVPYKLGGSREYVDSNNNDAWFTYTNQELNRFLVMVYLDLSRLLRQKIIRYIPGKHGYFFKGDREKVRCLQKDALSGDSICAQKVFYTEEGTFENIDHIVAFAKDEVVADPAYVHKLLEDPDKLFVPDYSVNMEHYGCRVIEDATGKLFKQGLNKPSSFEGILTWLEKNNSNLSYYKLLEANEPIRLNAVHISAIARHGQLWQAIITRAGQKLRDKYLPRYILTEKISEIDGRTKDLLLEIINNADLDDAFISYLKKIRYAFYVAENEKEFAIAVNEGVILAKGRELGSFAKFARMFDPHGTLTASMEIRQASERLNQVDDSMSNQEYLSLLHSVRKSLKDAYGKRMYDSYIKIIAEAGTDKKRFLNELLQNADDCIYPNESIPLLRLSIEGSELTITYNECGFTKDNVRAITAIGESTKKLLLSGDSHIGEKGVGFKSVFGVAESVEIHSNGFDFILTDALPTIPVKCASLKKQNGTTMIFQMKQDIQSSITAESILQLCVCLRKLKHLSILNHRLIINDDNERRVITLDGQKYIFERIVYDFKIMDQGALASRNTNGKAISPHQRIVCYIPKKAYDLQTYLYSGLPVKIKCNVPLIIDAPFELTTSRENILHNRWNEIIRKNLYDAILKVMHLKKDTGLDVFRYAGFQSQNHFLSWQTFDSSFLNYDCWPRMLSEAKILPTLGNNRKVSARYEKCSLVPDFIARLQKYEDITQFFNGVVIDTVGKNQYVPLLEKLGCRKVAGSDIYRFLYQMTRKYIGNKEFRDGLYAYLSNRQGNTVYEGIGGYVVTLSIFPIRVSGGTEYITYNKNIYYTQSAEVSNEEYYILDTEQMSLDQADAILSRLGRINELTPAVLRERYRATIKEYIENSQKKYTQSQIAEFILNEFRNNRTALSECRDTLLGLMPKIPFRMKDGNLKTGKKFLNTRDLWYAGKLVNSMIVDSNFEELAKYLECREIEYMHFDDIDFRLGVIYDDDIEDLQCDFVNYYEIIRNLINKGAISSDQIAKYNLEFGINYNEGVGDPFEEFPSLPVQNMLRLKRHILHRWESSRNRYIEKQYIMWKPEYPIDKANYTLSMYRSKNNSKKCFCQMCRCIVPLKYVERNDIEKTPAYAWEQMFLNLCLNCSKDYKVLRNNTVLWKQFIDNIMAADASSKGIIEIPIGGYSITFTATHLAEVQEIFKNEGWGDNAPKRRPILGKSVGDEEED